MSDFIFVTKMEEFANVLTSKFIEYSKYHTCEQVVGMMNRFIQMLADDPPAYNSKEELLATPKKSRTRPSRSASNHEESKTKESIKIASHAYEFP